jgi:hypothetical protein
VIDWLQDFYDDPALRETLMRSFLPVFSSYVREATGGPVAAPFVQALAESYVDRHLGSSRAQLQEVVKGADDPLAALTARFDEWEQKRPEKVAKNELVRSANAAQVEQFREAGVTKMVWRASGGKTCPFCTELDGTIISVDGTFFEEGDTLNPEGVTAPIHFESSLGHPPVHQGCVCSVEAVTETELDETQVATLSNDVDASNGNGAPRIRELAQQAGLSDEDADKLAIMSQGWNIDANSFDGWALREAAARRGATMGDLGRHPLWNQFVNRYAEGMRPQADRLLDLSTAEVQRRLGTTGSVRVYRGMTLGRPLEGIPMDGSVVDAAIEQRPLASWSLSKEEATKFASSSAEEYGGAAYVLEMDVPVTDVAGFAGTGLGNGAHGEVVLFGRPEHVARVFVPQD